MATETSKREDSKAKENNEITFECRFCEKSKPLDEMVVLTIFFPPVITCRDCEKKIR